MQDDEAVREFLIESNENLAKLDRELVELEQHPGDTQLVASIFRTIHTIKGTSGFFGFSILGSITHIAENILSQIRDKQRELTPALVSLILETVDAVKTILTAIESSGSEGQDIYQDLRQRLEQAHKAAAKSAAPAATVAATASPTPTATSAPTPAPTPTPPAQTAKPEPAKENIAAPQPAPLPAQAAAAAATPSTPISAPPAAEAAPKEQEPAATRSSAISESSIRVDVVLLDKLMNLVGELVLARNQILQVSPATRIPTFNDHDAETQSHHDRTAGKRDEDAHAADRQHLEQVPADVRDLAPGCGKQVRIEMEGEGNRTRQDASSRPSKIRSPTWCATRSTTASKRPKRARRREKPGRAPVLARLSRRRPGQHRNLRRRGGHQPGEDQQQGHREGPDLAPTRPRA